MDKTQHYAKVAETPKRARLSSLASDVPTATWQRSEGRPARNRLSAVVSMTAAFSVRLTSKR